MSSSFRRSPIFDLRDWWMSNPRLKEIFKIDQRGFAPFFPVQQQPESEVPYVVYDFKRITKREAWFYQADVLYMEINVIDFQDGYEIIGIMIDMANKGAISARDLSHWLRSENKRQDFELHSITFEGAGEAEPSSEQGGEIKISALFTIEYSPLQGNYIKDF